MTSGSSHGQGGLNRRIGPLQLRQSVQANPPNGRPGQAPSGTFDTIPGHNEGAHLAAMWKAQPMGTP